MALLGTAILAIWNGIATGGESDFVEWHVREHIPERIELPGFLRGRRYVGTNSHPAYFNFYETETVADLSSRIYQDRLDNPSAWTRRVVTSFVDTSRTVCRVVATTGRGVGGWVETVRFEMRGHAALNELQVMDRLGRAEGVVGVHLLEGQPHLSRTTTAEAALRSAPDEIAGHVLIVEAVEREALLVARSKILSDDALLAAGADPSINRGIYRLQFCLTKQDLSA